MSFSVDTSEFMANAQRLAESLGISLKDLAVKTAVSWANTAARLTPAYKNKVTGTSGEGIRTLKRATKFRQIVDLKSPGSYELSEIDKMQLRARKTLESHL